jgi:hypothetical protein
MRDKGKVSASWEGPQEEDAEDLPQRICFVIV